MIMMRRILFLYFALGILPLFCKAQTKDTISLSEFDRKIVEFDKPDYNSISYSKELGKRERRNHNILVYGCVYKSNNYLRTEGWKDDEFKGSHGIVYMVLDTVTNTFFWLDSGLDGIYARHTMYGSCKVEDDVLYLRPELTSRTTFDKDGKNTEFNDTIGLVYSKGESEASFQGNDFGCREWVKEYRFIFTEGQLRNITDKFLPWEMTREEWDEAMKEDNRQLPINRDVGLFPVSESFFDTWGETLLYPSVLYRIDLGPHDKHMYYYFIPYP